MSKTAKLAIPVCLFSVYIVWITGSAGTFIPNLTESCYRCLCYVSTGCEIGHECTAGYCGPFNISRVYWVDAGRVVMPEDDFERNNETINTPASITNPLLTSKGCSVPFPQCECQYGVFIAYLHADVTPWKDCARNYHCSKRIIEGYLMNFGKDCNGDGVTNCFDYMMVNGNGGYGCTQPLNRSVNGRRWLKRFEECRI